MHINIWRDFIELKFMVSAGNNKSNTSRTALIIAILVPLVVAVLLILSVCTYLRMRKAKKKVESKLKYSNSLFL